MTAIANFDALVAALTASTVQHRWAFKTGRVNGAAATSGVSGRMSSLWAHEGTPSGAYTSTPPSTAVAPTSATLGALALNNATSGKELWLTGFEENGGPVYGGFLMYDRLSHQGGLSGTSTSAQTTNLPTAALTRQTGGEGNEIWLEIYSALGASATTVTVSYTNESGTSGRTSVAVPIGGTNWNETGRIIQIPLQAGDKGVQSVQSVTLAATTGTIGNFGVVIARRLATCGHMQTGAGDSKDLISGIPSLPKIDDNSCLAFVYLAGSAAAPTPVLGVHICEN